MLILLSRNFTIYTFCVFFLMCSQLVLAQDTIPRKSGIAPSQTHGIGLTKYTEILAANGYESADVKIVQVKPGIFFSYATPKHYLYRSFFPLDIGKLCKESFTKDNTGNLVAIAASTGILIYFDQKITDNTRYVARHWGLKETDHQTSIIRGSVKVNGSILKLPLNAPSDANSILYFLGDGIVHLGVTGGIGVYGWVAEDDRAKQTCFQLLEAIANTGFVVQVLKHSTGRESAAVATQPGGVWRFFPSPEEYGKHIPKYDAYPTGHLATAMATVTVIAHNYPEKKWIKPFGYSLMTACGFAMVNNGVHWASDYPLGIAIGYSFAKIATRRSHTYIIDEKTEAKRSPLLRKLDQVEISPIFRPDFVGTGLTLPLE